MRNDIPKPACRHGESAYTDQSVGALDDNHIFCMKCGEVVCFNVIDPYKKSGRCSFCGTIMSETHKKQDDGIGTIHWVVLENGMAVSGGTI